MVPNRATELALASQRLHRTSDSLLHRARDAVQGSRSALESLRVTRREWATWRAVWTALSEVPRPGRALRVCGFCRRVRTPAGEWAAIPDPMLKSLEGWMDALPLSHGICPACAYEQYGMRLGEDGGVG